MRSADSPPPKKRRKARQRAPGAGRPPKPTALHLLEGTRPHTPRDREPKPPALREIVAPDWLAELRDDGCAVEFFSRVARGLVRLGVLTDLDVDALAVVAENYSLYRRCAARIPKRITTPRKGRTPIVYTVRRQALRDVHLGLAQFGLTPVARTKVIAGDDVPLPPSVQEQLAPEDRGADWMRAYGVAPTA